MRTMALLAVAFACACERKDPPTPTTVVSTATVATATASASSLPCATWTSLADGGIELTWPSSELVTGDAATYVIVAPTVKSPIAFEGDPVVDAAHTSAAAPSSSSGSIGGMGTVHKSAEGMMGDPSKAATGGYYGYEITEAHRIGAGCPIPPGYRAVGGNLPSKE